MKGAECLIGLGDDFERAIDVHFAFNQELIDLVDICFVIIGEFIAADNGKAFRQRGKVV